MTGSSTLLIANEFSDGLRTVKQMRAYAYAYIHNTEQILPDETKQYEQVYMAPGSPAPKNYLCIDIGIASIYYNPFQSAGLPN